MRIGLNLLFLIPGEVGGTQTYAVGLIDALSRLDPGNEYFLFTNQEARNFAWPEIENFHVVTCPLNARNKPWRLIWEQLFFPGFAKRFHLDMLHSLGYISPLFVPFKTIVTIHDLNYRFIPQSFSLLARAVQKILVESSIYKVDHILAVSQFTRDQIIRYFSVSPQKITVTLEAPTSTGKLTVDRSVRWVELAEKYHLRQPYLVTISSKSPHKNIVGLQKAYQIARNTYQLSAQLLVLGHLPPQPDPKHSPDPENWHSDMIFTGYLADQDLAVLLEKASLFVFPSLYEGFGLPVLEAMQSGVPVACSNQGSLPEIAGFAAMFFDPQDILQMASVISSIMQDQGLQDRLRSMGYEQVQNFSWEKTAKTTLSIYHQIEAL